MTVPNRPRSPALMLAVLLPGALLPAACAAFDEGAPAPVERTVQVDNRQIGVRTASPDALVLTVRHVPGRGAFRDDLPTLGQFWRAGQAAAPRGCNLQRLRLLPREDIQAEFACVGGAMAFDPQEPGFAEMLDTAEQEIAQRRERDLCTAQNVLRTGPRQVQIEARCTAQMGSAGGTFIVETLAIPRPGGEGS